MSEYDYNSDTDVMVLSSEYNYMYIRKGKNNFDMIWWIIASDVSDDKMVLREKDMWDLKDMLKFIDTDAGITRIHERIQRLRDK